MRSMVRLRVAGHLRVEICQCLTDRAIESALGCRRGGHPARRLAVFVGIVAHGGLQELHPLPGNALL